MKVKELPVEDGVGHVLLHSSPGPDGKRVVGKGRRLEASDIAALRAAGAAVVQVGVLEAGDVPEDAAALELAKALAGPGLTASPPRGGRVDLLAEAPGLFQVDVGRLLKVNSTPGVGVATALHNTPVSSGKRVVSAKIVPYAIAREKLDAALFACGATPVFSLKPFVVASAVLVTVGPPGSHSDLEEGFGASLGERLGKLGIRLVPGPRAAEEEADIRAAVEQALSSGPGMILIAGHSSIADVDDYVPRTLRSAGAEVVQHGLPTEPGSMLLLAYWGETPVVGVPGCARSLRRNGIDLVLPRLAAGERLGTTELAALGHGGLFG